LIGHVATVGQEADAAPIGEHARHAILLAVEQTNKEENRIAGKPVTVLHPRADPQQLAPLAVRLIRVDGVVALLGGNDAAEADALGRAAQAYDVPLITPALLLPQTPAENVFSVSPGLVQQGRMLARFAIQELKADRVSILVDGRRAESAALASAFANEFSREAGQSAKQWLYKTQADLTDAIARVTKEPGKAIFHAGPAGDLKRLQAARDQAGSAVPLLYGAGTSQLAVLLADAEAGKGVYLGTVYTDAIASGGNAEFVKKYRERFREAPGLHAALAYDAAQVLFEALRRALAGDKVLKPGAVRDQLANAKDVPFTSLTGPLTFDKDHAARRPLFIVQVENGGFKVIKQYDPEID
jgi:branched-chain amino acid transport system substrate-binding protein